MKSFTIEAVQGEHLSGALAVTLGGAMAVTSDTPDAVWNEAFQFIAEETDGLLLQSLQGDAVLGEAIVPLGDLELQDGMRVELWQTLQSATGPMGDVLLRLFQEAVPPSYAPSTLSVPYSPPRQAHTSSSASVTPAWPMSSSPTPSGALRLVIACAEGLPQGDFVAMVTLGNGHCLQTIPRPASKETVWDQSFPVFPHPEEAFDFSLVDARTGAVLGRFDLRGGDLMKDLGCEWQLPLKDAEGEVQCMLSVRMEEGPLTAPSPPPTAPPVTPASFQPAAAVAPPAVLPIEQPYLVRVESGVNFPPCQSVFVELVMDGQSVFTTARPCTGAVVFDNVFPFPLCPGSSMEVTVRGFDEVFGSAVLSTNDLLWACNSRSELAIEVFDRHGSPQGTVKLTVSPPGAIPEHSTLSTAASTVTSSSASVSRVPVSAMVEVAAVHLVPPPPPGGHLTMEMRLQPGTAFPGAPFPLTVDILEGRVLVDGQCRGQFALPLQQVPVDPPVEVGLTLDGQPTGSVTLRSTAPPAPPTQQLLLPEVPSALFAGAEESAPATPEMPRYRQRVIRHMLDGRIFSSEEGFVGFLPERSPVRPAPPVSMDGTLRGSPEGPPRRGRSRSASRSRVIPEPTSRTAPSPRLTPKERPQAAPPAPPRWAAPRSQRSASRSRVPKADVYPVRTAVF